MQKNQLNVFIITDLEGIAGVDDIADIDRTSPRFANARELLCKSINLAVTACFEAGATAVYYMDGHGGGGNVMEEKIDTRAVRCSVPEWEALLRRGEISCQMELGSHARAGTVYGFLDHTISSRQNYYIKHNGREMSEFALQATLCAKYGVPLVAVIGDRAACEQAKEYVPNVFVGAVKEADRRNRATSYEDADEILMNTIRAALEGYRTVSLIEVKEPLIVEQAYYRTDMCEDAMTRCPKVRRVDARTLEKTTERISLYADLMI